MHIINVAFFWASIALIAYAFAGYPLLLKCIALFRTKPVMRDAGYVPAVTVVIAAYNEEESIARKIENLRSLDYPSERIEILIGSDGSTDATVERLSAIADARIRIFDFPERRGKAAVLNAVIPHASAEIVVLADARQQFDRNALRGLTKPFADPAVGAVSGELMLLPNGKMIGDGCGAYWRYEKFIRGHESQIDSCVGATGAIYAIRKELFAPIPPDTILDDVLIPLRIARRGYRVIFEREARAYDAASSTSGQEFARKVRTLAGNFQMFRRERWLWNPIANRLCWQTLSHKALRLATAPLQLIAIAANAALFTSSAVYQIAFAGQVLFYAGAAAGWAWPRDWKRPYLISIPYTICLLSCATIVACLRFITARQNVTWKTTRSSLAPN